jgi:hypothetical protein
VRDMFQLNEIHNQFKNIRDVYSISRKKVSDG